MNKKLIILGLVLLLVLTVPGLALADDDDDRRDNTGIVTVVHGVPGLTVDVYVNGNLTLPNFEPGTISDPLKLPQGDYNIVIVPAGGDPATPAISGSAFLPAGANVSLVAHLAADGTPTLSAFVNDVSKIRPGKSRLVVRHTAAAPMVDILLTRLKGDDHDDDDRDDGDTPRDGRTYLIEDLQPHAAACNSGTVVDTRQRLVRKFVVEAS